MNFKVKMRNRRYEIESAILHEECKILYKKHFKVKMINEVLYKLFNENKDKYLENEKSNKTIYQKILHILGCH